MSPAAVCPYFKRDITLLGLGLLLAFLLGIDGHPYAVPSEARYIEIPRQMVDTGDWITPRLNGVKYFEKPPLFYWVQAAQLTYFGLGEFSGRFWTAITTLALCLVTSVAAYKRYGRLEGVLSPLILASCILVYFSSRVVLLDAPVSLFLVISLFSFMFAVESTSGRKRDGFLAIMYASAALATLTKGLIGIVIPAMVIGSWIALTGRWQLLRSVRLLPGSLLFLSIAGPWHYLAGRETSEFYYFYFFHEHFERFLTTTHGRYQPPWFFVAVLLAGFLPWTAFLFQAINTPLRRAWRLRHADGADLYLMLWIALVLLFFSLSKSQLVPYILPIFPVLALLIARYLAAIWRHGHTPGFHRGVYAMAGLFLVFAIAYPVMTVLGGKPATIVAPISTGMFWLSVILLAQSMTLFWMSRRGTAAPQLIKTMLLCAAITVTFTAYLAPHAATRSALDSAKPFAEYLRPRLRQGDEVAVFNHYYQDFPVYLNRDVTVVNAFGELGFGRSIEARTHRWMIDSETLLKRWKSKNRKMYLLLRRRHYEVNCFSYCPNGRVMFDNGGRNVLVSNHSE